MKHTIALWILVIGGATLGYGLSGISHGLLDPTKDGVIFGGLASPALIAFVWLQMELEKVKKK